MSYRKINAAHLAMADAQDLASLALLSQSSKEITGPAEDQLNYRQSRSIDKEDKKDKDSKKIEILSNSRSAKLLEKLMDVITPKDKKKKEAIEEEQKDTDGTTNVLSNPRGAKMIENIINEIKEKNKDIEEADKTKTSRK